MTDNGPDSTRPDPPSIYSAQLFDITADSVRVATTAASAWVQLGPVSVHGPVRLDVNVDAQLEALRDVGAAIVAQATAAIEHRARSVA